LQKQILRILIKISLGARKPSDSQHRPRLPLAKSKCIIYWYLEYY
jgi:hypothetical protein